MIVAAHKGGAAPSALAIALASLVVNVSPGEHGVRAAELLLEARRELKLAEAECEPNANRNAQEEHDEEQRHDADA